MVQFGAIRSRLAAINNRELTRNLGHFEADRAIFSRGNHRHFKWLGVDIRPESFEPDPPKYKVH